ncbi:MAG: class I SAM-dependent methyltransferase [Alphaproteobacteria bacterium]|nr:class I SAM-dependent methyltransferase [Alphaproteobacteria bacterium]MCB9690788.1 class I SAM-dependent methyltransferase [Alphaproteobacteria bacterium]
MSLAAATLPDGSRPSPALEAPAPADSLAPLAGVRFRLPCEDPWLLEEGTPAHTYLEAARAAWEEHEEWMDFLDLGSPAWDIKRAARDLYLEHLEPLIPEVSTALDLGCGIGRFTQVLLDHGVTVHGIDGDLLSLQRCAWHAVGRAGALDLHWSTARVLPDVQVDLALAVEVLCYLDDPTAALRELAARVRPGGHVFLAMEARWGWAVAQDAPPGGLDVALGDGSLLHLEGDRFVHLLDRDGMEALVRDAGLELVTLVATHYTADGPLEDLLTGELSREELLATEARLRAHPVWGPLNRIWTAVARKP